MLLIEILSLYRTFCGLMIHKIILAWSMTKKKSAVIKNYMIDPERVVLKNKLVVNPNYINRSEYVAKLLKSALSVLNS